MASKQITITDTFQASICSVCGCGDVNQYFGINDNFIEYCGVYFSFREILYEALDIQIDHYNGKTMEICLDCKDKVIKFYHFKRKVKEVQQSYKEKPVVLKENPKPLEKRSKVVHNIYQIIENYTEKCSVSTIRVDENSKKLIIESSSSQEPEVFTTPSLVQQQQPQQENTSERLSKRQTFVESPAHEQQQQDEIFCEPAIVIKDEVQDVDQQAIRLTLDENEQFNNFEEIDEDDSYYNSASTSYHPPNKKQKSDVIAITFPRIVIPNEMKTSQETIRSFESEMFCGRIASYSDHFIIVQLDFAKEDELFMHFTKKFSIPEFRRIKRYQIECKMCRVKIWVQIKSTYAIKRHMEICKKRSLRASLKQEDS